MVLHRLALVLLVSFAASLAPAHEFWISPEEFQVEPNAPVVARLRVGEKFKGASYIYSPSRFVRFDLVTSDGVVPVEGRMGDDPALAMPAAEGLVVIVHETSDSSLTYRERAKFENFVAHKDFANALERHAARGLPETGFRESYRRFAKALVAVGDGAGADEVVGLETEIVAGSNPYTDDLRDGMPLTVLYQGRPRAGVQLELFDRSPNGEVAVTLHRTDPDGRVVVPVTPGHAYLADAVVLKETGNDDPEAGPVWRSLWAALTFAVPAD